MPLSQVSTFPKSIDDLNLHVANLNCLLLLGAGPMVGPGQPMPGRMMTGPPPVGPPQGGMPPMMGPRHPGPLNGMCEYPFRFRFCPLLGYIKAALNRILFATDTGPPPPQPTQPDVMPPVPVGPPISAPAPRAAEN